MPTEPECPVCGAPLYDNQTICNGCRNRLETCLLETGSLIRDLDVTLTKQSKIIHNHASTELDPLKSVFHMGASNAGQALRHMLAAWASLIQAETGNRYPWKPDTIHLAAYILHHLRWLAQHEAGADAYNEITEAYADVEHVIDIDPETRIVGTCGHETENGACPQTIWARTTARTVQCRTCGTTYDVHERVLDTYMQAMTTTATAITITRAFNLQGIPIESNRLAVWTRRGLLTQTSPRRYNIAHVARLIQLYESGAPLTPYEEKAPTS